MKTKQKILFIAIILLCAAKTFAQNALVNVNTLTGAANVVIPVYSFTRGQVTFPISLVYAGSGIKIKDVEGTAGIGWNLQAGGQVSRLLRGLPDDCSVDNTGNSRLGFMNSSNTAIDYITGINDNNSDCAQETTDLAYINSHFPYTMDTEPDIFYVTAPGLSCQLVYDRNSSGFRTLNYQDLKISYTLSAGQITSFTIINDKGIKYVFSDWEPVSVITLGVTPNYFKTKYLQYQNQINYHDNWHLSSITDPNGNGIILNYTTGVTRVRVDPVSLYNPGTVIETMQYKIRQSNTPKTLSRILSTDGDLVKTELDFIWQSSPQSAGGTNQMYIDTIRGMAKVLNFDYSSVKYSIPTGGNYYRQFLRSFVEGSANSPIYYTFSYYGETHVPPVSGNNYTTTLPDSNSTRMDYWGFYGKDANTQLLPQVWVNPGSPNFQRYLIYQSSTGGTNYPYTIPGNVMTVDTANVRTGALKSITNARGGTTTITYEANDFLDPQTGLVNPGNGIRAKQVKDDAHAGTPAMVRNYSYLGPSGVSSGEPVTLPQFAFTVPYGGTETGAALWANSTMLSTSDLSEEDHTIMYSYCRESQANGGVTLYQYYVPATNWSTSAVPGCSGCTTSDWAPTVDMIARHDCKLNYGKISNTTYGYPFIPNPNYDFERGLLQKVTSYLDNGTTEVAETSYTYSRSFTPSIVYGFRYDDNHNLGGSLVVTGYNKYGVNFNTSELTATATKKVYNAPGYAAAQISSATYTYGSASHKKITQQDVANSDGSTVTTKISYTKDYQSAGAATNRNVNAIYNLNLLNVNVPVETYQQVTRSGSTKITGGSITLFKDFGAFYLPAQQLQLVQPDGILSSGFAPFTVTGSGAGQSLAYNSNYFPVANYTGYDFSGYLVTSDDNNHDVLTKAIDHNTYQPAITIKNAAFNEVAFTDFNSTCGIAGFAISGTGTLLPDNGHTGNGYLFGTAQSLTATLTKNTLASQYIFSVWINATAGATNTLHISLNGGAATAYTYTGTGSWKYYEWKIPVSTMPASFTATVTSSQAIPIDDLLFYPATAEVATFSYDAATYVKNAQTDTNGVSTYYKNDEWGRVIYVYDQDHNIIQRNTYIIPGPVL